MYVETSCIYKNTKSAEAASKKQNSLYIET